jgi:hypothetical protein
LVLAAALVVAAVIACFALGRLVLSLGIVVTIVIGVIASLREVLANVREVLRRLFDRFGNFYRCGIGFVLDFFVDFC